MKTKTKRVFVYLPIILTRALKKSYIIHTHVDSQSMRFSYQL